MQTSYFAKSAKDPNAVSVAIGTPPWFKGRQYPKLAPSWDLVKNYKNGKLTQSQYETRYKAEILDKLNPKIVFEEIGNNAILLCWEKSNEFCHRHLISKWLSDTLNCEIKEKE